MATQVADSIGAELVCIDVDSCLPFSNLVSANPPSSLSQDMLFLGIDKAISQAVGPSSVLLEGQGGDLLFNAVPDVRAVLDALRDRGWSFALQTAGKLALLHNESIPRILLMAAKLEARRRVFRSDARTSSETMSRLLHPLDRCVTSVRSHSWSPHEPGDCHFSQQELDQFLSVMTPVTDLFITRRINPFLAQPIVEAAANIRSYASFDERNDRIVLRKIAEKITPIDVLRRRTKGTFDVGFINGIRSNRDAFHELVHNGVLMQAGRIDELEVRRALKAVQVGQGTAAISLALLGCVEIYCASWQKFIASRPGSPC
nr:asparagine synthase-related protein [Trinickia diaoshuihuensis]